MQKIQLLLILILSSILFFNSERLIASHQKKSKTPKVTKALSLDGAYEFVSLTTTLSKPEKSIETMEASEWIGYWILVNGHFSFNFMKVERDSWHAGLPPGLFELECDSGAGSYKIEKSQINFYREISMSPDSVGFTETYDYKLTGNKLILTEKLFPYTEDSRQGERVLVLRKIKSFK